MSRFTVSCKTTSSENVRMIPPEISRAISSRIFLVSEAAPKNTFLFAISDAGCVARASVISPFSVNAFSVESGSADRTCKTSFSGEKLSSVFFKDRSRSLRSHCLSFVCLPSRLSFLTDVSIFGAASGDMSSSERIS